MVCLLRNVVSHDGRAAPSDAAVVPVLKHRDDVQGLRAVAVLLVVLDHAGVSFLRGGYVGVDVFFVLSGFLITGILLSGAVKRGYVSLVDFYSRRARRILPAATLTLIVTTIVSYRLLNYVRAKEAVWDSFWASLFASNIRFAHQGTDYFAQGQPPSVVQHYWSLAVEEQFYLVWPALLALTLFGVVSGRRRRDRRRGGEETPVITNWAMRRLSFVVLVAAIVSLVWSVEYTNRAPAAAYFSTVARAWELGLGALLAIGALHVARVPAQIRALLGWLGFAAILIAAATFSTTTPFPGSAALLPAVGAALVIGAGVGQQSRLGVGRLLGIAPMRYVGDRSYSYYLWHWPVLIIAVEYVGHDLSVGMNLLLVLGAFLLSVITFRLVEDPIRRSHWSAPRSAMLVPSSVGAVVLATMLALTFINAKVFRLEKASAAAKAAMAGSLGTGQGVARSQTLPAVVAAVKAARQGAKIPSVLTPPVSNLLKDIYSFPPGCVPATDSQTTSQICRLGDASSAKSIVLFGDSHAQMWMPTLLAMAERDGWVIIPLVKSACTPATWLGKGYANTPKPLLRACHTWYKWALGQAQVLHPTVTLMAGCCGGDATVATDERRGFSSLAKTMKPSSTSVILVADNEGVSKQPVDCLLRRRATMRTCTTKWPAARFAFINSLAKLARTNGFEFLKTRGWFCYQHECPMVVGRRIVYRDTAHITKTYALALKGVFRSTFRRCIIDACPR
jgi:peptidoglycan/LPS O-acetylase OafA/YrhL